MADRRVTKSRKESDGDITALCSEDQLWSPRFKNGAIQDIESGSHTYYVQQAGGPRTDIRVVAGPSGKYLRTDPDTTTANNLDDLPDC